MQLELAAIDGTYPELMDAAENVVEILSAKESNQVELTPVVEGWLIALLERIELCLATDAIEADGGAA